MVRLFLQSLLTLLLWGPVCESTIGKRARRLEKWVLGKKHLQGKFQVGHWRLCGEGYMLDACGMTHEYGDVLKKLAGLKLLFEKLRSALWQRKANGWCSWLASTVGCSAGYQCPTGVWNLSQKVGKGVQIRYGCAVIYYCSSFRASRQGAIAGS